MEQNETDVANISCITTSIPRSRDYVRKQRAKHSSVKLYCSLLCHYDVHLACDICICIDEETHKCRLNTLYHKCDKNRLVLFTRNTTDDGELLRQRPAGYNPLRTDRICEHLELNEQCLEMHRCPYPHTDVERVLWKEDYNDRTCIASLVHDICESSLQLSVVIDLLSKKFGGTFKLICGMCYKESHDSVRKHRHVPECQSPNSHYWGNKNKKLVFEMSLNNQLIAFDDVNTYDKEKEELVSCVKSLIKIASVDVIANEAARMRQTDSSLSCTARRTEHREAEHHNPYDSESEDSNNKNSHLANTDEEIFDEDASNVLNEAAFDADTGDSMNDVTRSRIKGDYYTMLTEEQAQDDSEVIYGCGKITLHGAYAGSCTIVGGELNGCEVELRGRFNCGPAFDGDEVQVKVYKKDERADEVYSSSKLYGTVVRVIKRNVHRTARTFVCTVGKQHGHLMTPLCGTVPKFRIVDSCLFKQYGPVKKGDYVAVYNTDLELVKTVRLDPCRRKEMLFVVKYLKWETKHEYPLGYVCRILRESHTVEESQKMLSLMYELPTATDTESGEELTDHKEEDADHEEEDAEVVERTDLCRLLTVSVDALRTKAVDDALSLEELDGNFVVWTHIADVTHYIQKGDYHDENAQRHMSSFCSTSRRPVYMLPKKFTEDKCSLLAERRRRAMSVRFELSAGGEVLSFQGPVPSWIENNKQLSYEDVQKIVASPHDVDNCGEQSIEQMLIHLHKLATELRKRRMGDGSHYYEYSRKHCFNSEGIGDPFDEDQNHDAKWIVEEFMILTNQHVGGILKEKFPDCIPFLVQSAPEDNRVESWEGIHDYIIPFSFYFSQLTEHLGERPTNKDTESEEELADHEKKDAEVVERKQTTKKQLQSASCDITQLYMLRSCLVALNAAVDQGDVRKVRTIIGSELLHPLHSIALSSWFDIQEPSQYICYVDDGLHDTMHFSLQTRDYVHFTSPLRRYVDIIAHRLVKTDPDQFPPYTQDEVSVLCDKMNACKSRQRSYDDDCELLNIASMLKKPMYIPCYVESFDEFSIWLVCPYFDTDSPLARRVKFSEMTLFNSPVICDGKLTLTWSKRYYDTRMSRTTNARSDAVTEYFLDYGMFATTVQPHVWSSMHKAVKGQTKTLLAGVSQALQADCSMQQQQQQEEECITAQEVTSEMADNTPLVRHHVKFCCEIAIGTVVPVQFGARCIKGFLQPVIKLVNLTPDKDICVEHQRDPVSAFASVATKKVKDTYRNFEEYQNIWQAILEMEAATNVVRNDSIVCSHVPVRFVKRNGRIYGTLKLSKEFCDKRSISVYTVSEEETHDYMCIRYFLEAARLTKRFIRNVWVAHAVVVSCRCTNDEIKLTVKCSSDESKAPSELFKAVPTPVECTVEFLQRTLPDK